MMQSKRFIFSLVIALGIALPATASAFCGFYVAGADAKLYNNATMVTLMRDGTTTVLSMRNNYQGPPKDFAMVIPVPVVLQKSDVKTLPHSVFERLDKLAAPRLVEYWEQDPCRQTGPGKGWGTIGTGTYGTIGRGSGAGGAAPQVVVEAQFEVGEYEIVILSAKDALALEGWITGNGYKIPSGAAPFLKPYVEQGSKFFVARVNPKKVKFVDGMASLSPLRFHYTEKEFHLPIRLGLINAKDKQDLIVHILAKGRYEAANYKNVTIPTNVLVSESVRERFGEFYAALFDATTEKNPNSIVTEYSWNANSCDPCPDAPLRDEELMTLGLDVIDGRSPAKEDEEASKYGQVRPGQTTTSAGLDANIVRRYIRRVLPRIRLCYQKELTTKPKLSGTTTGRFSIKPDGTVAKSTARGMGNASIESCVAKTLKQVTFPKPAPGKTVEVKVPLTFSLQPRSSRRGFRASSGWVLTRLHARYDRASLGDDLIFKQVSPIAGGQGGASDTLSKVAVPSRVNSFQGRYIIRHEWEGALECESPQRGVWGAPPADTKHTKAIAATDLAFAARGNLSLANALQEPVAALGLGSASVPKEAPKGAVATEAVNQEPNETSRASPVAVSEAPVAVSEAPVAVSEAPVAVSGAPSSDQDAPKEDEPKAKGCSAVGGGGMPTGLLLGLLLLFLGRRRQLSCGR